MTRLLFAIWRRFHHYDSTFLFWPPFLVCSPLGVRPRPFLLTVISAADIGVGDILSIGCRERMRVMEVWE
jgi:hypothetical protein